MRSAWIALAALLIASPLSLAAPGFLASDLSIDGSTRVGGDAAALFALAGAGGLAWDGSAASVVVERTYTGFVRQDASGRVPSNTLYDDPKTETLTFGASTFVGTQAREEGALLALVSTSDFELSAVVDALAIQPEHDPDLQQGPPPDVDTDSGSDTGPDYRIRQVVRGDFLNLTAPNGVFEIRGNFVLRMLDVDYALTFDGQTTQMRTGDVPERQAGLVTKGQRETHKVTLTDAVLRVRASDPITLLATRPVVTFSGELSASDPQGALDLPLLTPAEPGRWTGSGTLALAPGAGAVALLAPAPADAAGGARAARGPELAAAGVVVLALALAGLAALALRLRRARGDDLELAVLAMEERRWADALPHLDRLAARRPHDPVVLMDRAICLEESGRLGEAREGYEATLRVEPHNAEAHYYYARTLARMRMGTASLAHLSRALTLDGRLAELARKEAAFSGFQDHPLFRGLVR